MRVTRCSIFTTYVSWGHMATILARQKPRNIFFTTYQPNPERLHSACGPSHATLPVSPIRLTDRAERLALVSSTQRTAIEALRSTPAGTRWAVQLRRTIVHISLFAAQLLRDGL